MGSIQSCGFLRIFTYMDYGLFLVRLGIYYIIRLIPQGTVDNNLGPDRLAGQKALDPNYCRQPTF